MSSSTRHVVKHLTAVQVEPVMGGHDGGAMGGHGGAMGGRGGAMGELQEQQELQQKQQQQQ